MEVKKKLPKNVKLEPKPKIRTQSCGKLCTGVQIPSPNANVQNSIIQIFKGIKYKKYGCQICHYA